MAVANLLKLVLHWRGYGEEGTLTWHINHATAQDQDGLQSMLAAIVDSWESEETPSWRTNFRGLLMTPQSCDTATLYQYASAPGPATVTAQQNLTGWVGIATAMTGPLQECQVVTLETGAAGRRNRGRQYYPGFTRAMVAASALINDGDTDQLGEIAGQGAGDAVSAIRTIGGQDGARWCVFSPTGGSARDVTSFHVDNRPDTQRRRAASLSSSHVYSADVGP